MIDLSEPLHIYGYHGTSLEAAQGIIEQGFNVSTNDYDWLEEFTFFKMPLNVLGLGQLKDILTRLP